MRTKTTEILARVALVVVTVAVGGGCDEDDVTGVRNTDIVAQEPFSFEMPVTTQHTFRLVGINGSVAVTGAAGVTEISVSGTRKVGSDSMDDAEFHLAGLTVESSTSAAELLVRTVQPQNTEGRQYVVDYTVEIPQDLIVGVANANGEITVTDVQADVRVAEVNGTIVIGTVVGDLDLTLANGQIIVAATLPSGGEFDLEVTNGSIALQIPQDTSASLLARILIGTIFWSDLTLTDLVDTPNLLSGTLGDGDGSIVLYVANGGIEIAGN